MTGANSFSDRMSPMKRLTFTLLIFLFALALLTTAPQAAHSQEPGPPPLATAGSAADSTPASPTFGPTAVQPNTVSNVADTQLVVTGSGFLEGSAVILDGYGALDTTFVSASMLRALLPAGAPAGRYHVRVVNPDASAAVLENGLTITAPAPTAGPTDTPQPTNTPAPTAFVRPVIVVQSYGASAAEITPGSNLDFEMTLANAGQTTATNVIATFVTGDFTPRATGGVRAIGNLTPGQSSRFWQPLAAGSGLTGGGIATLQVRVTYTDVSGTAYEETFALTFPVRRAASGVAATATPTPTATATATAAPRLRPQLLVAHYAADKDPLSPGSRFNLSMDVLNQGTSGARRITLIVGGGVEGSLPPAEGTPPPGGVPGAGGEFGNFAPVGSSNVRFLGDLAQNETLTANVELIVNANTDPGAYPVIVSFVYTDAEGASYIDEQVVTLLVFETPNVDINFYMEPPPLFVGQPGPLPVQLVNIGKASTIFGNMNVSAPGAQLTNNNVFVGALEPGGFYPLDANIIPAEPGPLDLTVRVSYTDDFNQPQVITRTLTVEVMDAPVFEEPPIDPNTGEPINPEGPIGPGGPFPGDEGASGNETWRQKAWRFILGLLGLSSGPPASDPGMMPGEGIPPMDGPVMPGPSGPGVGGPAQ